MATLTLFTDYDNVDPALRMAGPVNLAKTLVGVLPSETVLRHSGVHVRLYGGWRTGGFLTNSAQNLVPDIRANSPTYIGIAHRGAVVQMRLTVELAERPIGSLAIFGETLAKERGLRKFRARRQPWSQCATPNVCGMNPFVGASHSTPCTAPGCNVRLGDVLIRDEQKMVDTLIVADIAHQALIQRVNDVVVVSSDADVWPGILLALQGGCRVTQLHPSPGWRTQRHLLGTLDTRTATNYRQLSV